MKKTTDSELIFIYWEDYNLYNNGNKKNYIH